MINTKIEKLKELIVSYQSAVLAFSGGVDSTLLLKIAFDCLGDNVIAVTAVSASMQAKDADLVKKVVNMIGVKHTTVETKEFDDPRYLKNDPQRCYFCKTHIGSSLINYAKENAYNFILDGNNADDTSDYRPGMKAAEELGIVSPLKETGFTKNEIRKLSKEYGLPNWDKPASPCLSSRIPYGTPVTVEVLRKIDVAENYLHSLSLQNVRVRYHTDVARIEVEPDDFKIILSKREKIIDKLKSLGFQYVSLDIQGFRSGSLNEILPNG